MNRVIGCRHTERWFQMSKKFCVLFNPASGNAHESKLKSDLQRMMPGDEFQFIDIIKVSKDYPAFFRTLDNDVSLLVTGGDGTLNNFVNNCGNSYGSRSVFFFPTGSGNDFWKDIGQKIGDKPVNITRYITDLPVVEVEGRIYRFLNNVGFGLDGYCTEEGEAYHKRTGKAPNYSSIAVKGMLGKFAPRDCTVTVDGKTHRFHSIWLVPTLNGRYYGGGMLAAPKQQRLSKSKILSCSIIGNCGRIAALLLFKNFSSGNHEKNPKNIIDLTGHRITVEFDKPCTLQIDGETFRNIKSYTAYYPGF